MLRPEQIRTRIDLSEEDNQFVREVSYNGKKTFLRMFDDTTARPAEAETSAALSRLVGESQKITFVTWSWRT